MVHIGERTEHSMRSINSKDGVSFSENYASQSQQKTTHPTQRMLQVLHNTQYGAGCINSPAVSRQFDASTQATRDVTVQRLLGAALHKHREL